MAKKTQVESKNKAWVANYPPLHEWLHKIGARCLDQTALGDPDVGGYLESWAVGGSAFLLVVRPFQHGWNIYTACMSNEIEATLRDAEARLGLKIGDR